MYTKRFSNGKSALKVKNAKKKTQMPFPTEKIIEFIYDYAFGLFCKHPKGNETATAAAGLLFCLARTQFVCVFLCISLFDP